MSDATKRAVTRRHVLKLGLATAGAMATGVRGGVMPPASAAQAAGQKGPLIIWCEVAFLKEVDEVMAATFKAWGAKNGWAVDYQTIPPPPESLQRLTAAIEAKSPPDADHLFEGDLQYYRAQGILADVSDVINEIKGLEGGLYEAAFLGVGYQGKYYGIPYTLNPWVMHSRDDVLKAAGVAYPKTWEEMIKVSPKISKPPQVYTYAMSLGDNDDTDKNFFQIVWGYGGALQNQQGALTFKSRETLEAIKVVKEMYDKKVIPPGATTWDASGNNKAYQARQAIFSLNPNTIYAWLDVNDKPLMELTGMYGTPAGPKGHFDLIDVRSFAVFKDAKNPGPAKEALRYFVQPANYEKVIETSMNRYQPIYKNMMNRPMWQKPAYKEYKNIMQNARVLAYAGPPNPAQGEVHSTWITAHMLQEVCSGAKTPEKAMNDAYDQMVPIYKKWKQAIA
jgi:multiple sugar transport system substrate-binding protein